MVPDDKNRETSGPVNDAGTFGAGDDNKFSYGDTSQIEDDLDRELARQDHGEEIVDEGGLDFDFPAESRKSSGLGKAAVPLLVLAVAGAIGGAIVLYPQIAGIKQPALPEVPTDVAMAPQDPVAGTDISEMPQQPVPAENQTVPEGSLTPDPPMDPASPHEETAEAPPPAAVASDQPLQPEPPVETASAGDSAQPVPVGTPDAEFSVPTEGAPVSDSPGAADPAALSAPAENGPAGQEEKSPEIAAASKDIAPKNAGSVPASVPDADVPVPDPAPLKPAEPPPVSAQVPGEGSVPPVSPAQGAQASGTTVPNAAPHPDDAYYDAGIAPPSEKMSMAVGPRKVDPAMEPGQKFVIVEGVLKPDDIRSIVASAERSLKMGRYDSALEIYSRLYAKNPRDPRIVMGRAVAQQNLGMDDSAIRSYEEFLKIDPDNADAMVNLLGLLKNKSPSVALNRLLDLQGRFPSHPGLAAQIGITEADMGNYQEAMRYLGMAAGLEPENPQHPFNMAVIADRQGKTAEAVRFYEQALDIGAVDEGSASIPRESIMDRLAVLRRR